jgi:hypothetical protein
VEKRLGISENKAMKLLISTFVTLLLLGFAGSSYGQDANNAESIVDGLSRLAEMHEQGLLTEAEFTAAKGKLLGASNNSAAMTTTDPVIAIEDTIKISDDLSAVNDATVNAGNAEEQEIVFQPAIFGEFKKQFISKIKIPSNYNDFSIIIRCSGAIRANGRFANGVQAICDQQDNSVGLEGQSFSFIFSQISKASKNLQVEPASVNGIKKNIWFNFHVNINKADGRLSITVNENHLINASLLGTEYIASQRYEPSKIPFITNCLRRRNSVTIGANVSSTGSASGYNIIGNDNPSNSCVRSVERTIEESGFIPAFVDAQPVNSVWTELFYRSGGVHNL